jgi:yeast amino acid transporter
MDKKMKVEGDTELALAASNNIGKMQDPAHPEGTKRGLKSRHAQMIALGGTIGTGLFVGSGQSLRIGGPTFFFAGYCIITVLVFGIVSSPWLPTHLWSS